jgi:LacI family transcriptional regulator, galactose operon repressor
LDARGSRIRLADVAKLAGVSTTTASRALNGRGELTEETRTAVLDAAAQLGFRPSPFAQSLRTKRSHTVGLIVPHVAHPFYASILQGAQSYLHEAGYRVILVDSGEDPQSVADAINTLLDHWVDGILISITPFPSSRFAELLRGTPCVFIDETVPDIGVGSVILENREGVGALVGHLASHGHTRIGFLGGPNDRTDGRERLEGYRAAMAAHSIAVDQALVAECEWNLRSGIDHTLRLLDLPGAPTAIAAASAELALGALAAARSRGLLLPADLAIASFDDTYFAPLLEPALTAISYDTPFMGESSARLLVKSIEADQPPAYEEIRIGVKLIQRRSCGCDYEFIAALDQATADALS